MEIAKKGSKVDDWVSTLLIINIITGRRRPINEVQIKPLYFFPVKPEITVSGGSTVLKSNVKESQSFILRRGYLFTAPLSRRERCPLEWLIERYVSALDNAELLLAIEKVPHPTKARTTDRDRESTNIDKESFFGLIPGSPIVSRGTNFHTGESGTLGSIAATRFATRHA
ncbi:hypothetical protein EVAR_721_1 [Eumeta japonica]|uniref:Uncharacterized protein n=1 Tax=Eumeta variegata TaxID=151549 RepID=A0A4C1SEN9_EUMVA|nr:hypothetical protein EVAR_721_1 [Eumeta japonica]